MPEGPQQDVLNSLQEQVPKGRNYDSPPLHLWHPALSGDIDIVIQPDGSWWHEGAPIKREAIVRVFASILRREEDGEYYLVTPGEKWRIQVESHALLVVEIDPEEGATATTLIATLNTGKRYTIGAEHPLFLDKDNEGVAGIELPHGLSALCSRAAWYRLVEQAEEVNGIATIRSAGQSWALQ